MTVHQRDIIEIAFYTGRTPQTHPALVVSKDEIFETEGYIKLPTAAANPQPITAVRENTNFSFL